ncbi:bifunctional glutamate N-acetyltransferase/amino-acid acetyltransferase ArgJ [Myxococcota bacterium]|nr:bifunctional glutamate N-acetyltransferase/amino-acid acetyltransferase ArgJ [Myxococcota bacterium]
MTESIVPGFRAAGVRCGLKTRGPDLMLIASEAPSAAAGVFTRSTVVGAPVTLSRARIRRGQARAIVANSGCSNVAMGARGDADALAMTEAAARALGCPPTDVLVASTGVIGQPLPLARIRRGLPKAAAALRPEGLLEAAQAIMTTDTVPKLASVRTRIGGRLVTLAGIAKGSGMIEPNMATMLSFLLTDAAVTPALLRRLLRAAVATSYNRLTVDGEGSTSDTVLLLANGCAGHPPLQDAASSGSLRLAAALGEVCEELARALARDGEGATKLVTVRVAGARSAAEAERAAKRIANSVLVKTALFGGDPNWGRILQTIGAGRIVIDLPRASVQLGGVSVFRSGASTGPEARRRAGRALRASEIDVVVHLGAGRHAATVWTCDLSYEYVRVNAEYTT